jgi:hypothetical protein
VKENPRAEIEVEHVIPFAFLGDFPRAVYSFLSLYLHPNHNSLFVVILQGGTPGGIMDIQFIPWVYLLRNLLVSLRLSIWLVSDNPPGPWRTLKATYQSRIFFLFETIRKVPLSSKSSYRHF